jgi:hypothetical protein
MPRINSTLLVFHLERSWANLLAPENIPSMRCTFAVSQSEMSELNKYALEKRLLIVVQRAVSHAERFPLNDVAELNT